jgi:hypothetical protein
MLWIVEAARCLEAGCGSKSFPISLLAHLNFTVCTQRLLYIFRGFHITPQHSMYYIFFSIHNRPLLSASNTPQLLLFPASWVNLSLASGQIHSLFTSDYPIVFNLGTKLQMNGRKIYNLFDSCNNGARPCQMLCCLWPRGKT